tara:strand:+ start:972 stop:1211 length:240 start_codon:yes stop_codon:yes gene_type:complete
MANSDSRILFKQEDGTVAIVSPSDNCGLTVEEIAVKDVPKGFKFKIVPKSEIPSDTTFRNAWIVDEADLTDGVGEADLS